MYKLYFLTVSHKFITVDTCEKLGKRHILARNQARKKVKVLSLECMGLVK